MPTKSITRAELHRLVWSRPMRDVAADFRLSDVGLKKICIRHDVPVPPQGHWQRVEHGRGDEPIPLGGRVQQIINIQVGDAPPDLPDDDARRLAELLAAEEIPSRAVVVSKVQVKLHPIAAAAQKALLSDKPDQDWGAVRFKSAGLDVRVSPSGVPRAIRIIDALFKAMQARSFLNLETRTIVIEGERFPLSIEEIQRRVRHVPTPEEKARRKARANMSWEQHLRSNWPSEPSWDFRPSNEFAIKRSSYTYVVRDSARSVEERLNEVPSILIKIAFAEKAEERARQRRQVYLDRLAERRRQQRRLEEIEDEAAERLEAHARRWDAAQRIRAFIRAVEGVAIEPDLEPRRRRWIDWASGHAASLDPLNEPRALFSGDLDEMDELNELLARDPPTE
jgi:hypothetical protein